MPVNASLTINKSKFTKSLYPYHKAIKIILPIVGKFSIIVLFITSLLMLCIKRVIRRPFQKETSPATDIFQDHYYAPNLYKESFSKNYPIFPTDTVSDEIDKFSYTYNK